MPRLFVAIDLPAQIKEELAGFSPELPAGRWVGPEEIHLTLRFIGEVGPESFTSIRAALARVSFSAFPLTLRGVGHFPPGRHPRVLWVGIDPCDRLMQLQEDLELLLLDTGIPAEERRFSPHITLARLKETVPSAVDGFEVRHRDLVYPSFEVSEFILYSSTLTRQGAVHRKEEVYQGRQAPLSPSAP
jgi:RNA 2',3'-cyclic 3'-phosphodiesterase